jgi:hypothetical protein
MTNEMKAAAMDRAGELPITMHEPAALTAPKFQRYLILCDGQNASITPRDDGGYYRASDVDAALTAAQPVQPVWSDAEIIKAATTNAEIIALHKELAKTVLQRDSIEARWVSQKTEIIYLQEQLLKAIESAQPVQLSASVVSEPVDQMDTVAIKYAHSLALELETVLSAYSGTHWDKAIQVLGNYRSAMNEIHEGESPTFMGEPLIKGNQQ